MAADDLSSLWGRVEGRLDGIETRIRLLEMSSVERGARIRDLDELIEGFSSLRKELNEIKAAALKDIADREAAQVARLERKEHDRVTRRRWVIGSAFTATGLIIAASAIIVQILDST